MSGGNYKLEVCDECGYQWEKGTKPVHRETCSEADEDNFFGCVNGDEEDQSE